MLLPAPPLYPRKRKPRQKAKRRVTGLTLVSAVYSEGDALLTLAFDRAIDIDAIDGNHISVIDNSFEVEFRGTGDATLIAPDRVRIMLEVVGPMIGPGVTLTASAQNGIVAVDDGGTWAGVTELELPFP